MVRKTRKYAAVGVSIILAISLIGINAAGAEERKLQRYKRFIDAGNTGAAVTTGKIKWEPQTGFTGGTTSTVSDLKSKRFGTVKSTVLTGSTAFALQVPNGKYHVGLWVLSNGSDGVVITAEGKAKKPLRAKSTSKTRLRIVTVRAQVEDGTLNLAFGNSSKLGIAALAIGGGIASTTSTTTGGSTNTTVKPTTTTAAPSSSTTIAPTTTVAPATTTTTARPATTTTVAPTPTTTPTGTRTCTNPKFTTSDTNGGITDGGYYVHNNMWNASSGETMYVCAYNNWYVEASGYSGTAVRTYPNVHKDINNMDGAPWNNYKTITSTFAGKGPGVGIYNVAYDLWLNGVGWGNGTTEVMIWTENVKQRPLGSVKATITSSGMTWDVWHYQGDGANVVSFVAKQTMYSGNLNLKDMVDQAIGKGYIPANPSVNQIGYGVEICDTAGAKQRYTFTDFSLTMN